MNTKFFATRPFRTLILTASSAAILAAQAGPLHFQDANTLITDLASDSANVNIYDGDGNLTDKIDWTGSPRTAISVCGTFMTMLLKHTYGLTNAQFTAKTGSTSPNATKYHDAIVAESGFTRVPRVDQLVPGDIMAIKYPASMQSSGHVMMVQVLGDYHQRSDSRQEFLLNGNQPDVMGYYDVTVIDSSSSYHGSSDSRHSKPGGIGRNGIFRIYVDNNFVITGYTWSTAKTSEYKRTVDGFDLTLGRIVTGSW